MKNLQIAVALGLVLAASPTLAQAPSPTAASPAIPGVSPQGMAVIARVQKAGDPIGQAAIQKLRALLPQVSQAALAPSVDVEKFAGLLKQQDAISTQIQSRRSEMMISILRQLPAADRGPFLRAIATRVPTQAAPSQAR